MATFSGVNRPADAQVPALPNAVLHASPGVPRGRYDHPGRAQTLSRTRDSPYSPKQQSGASDAFQSGIHAADGPRAVLRGDLQGGHLVGGILANLGGDPALRRSSAAKTVELRPWPRASFQEKNPILRTAIPRASASSIIVDARREPSRWR